MPADVGPDEVRESLRADIALSWQRVSMSGLDPAAEFETDTDDIDVHSTLLAGATPVLEELEHSLVGTDYSTVLVDRDCRVVRRWCDDPRMEQGFDALNISLGACLLEENVGTNALGTVMVTRQGLAINGHEHFAESLQGFSCYGHPIRHPLTKRIEGVLDVTAVMERANPLLQPLITRAVHDIEQRLLDGSRMSEKSLLAAFQTASATRRRAILAIGEDMVLSNHAANDLLMPPDVALLRALVEEPQPREHHTLELTLAAGQAVSVTISRVTGARRGALLRVEPVAVDRARPVRGRSYDDGRAVGATRLVTGVPGSGRSTRARALATDHPPLKVMRAASALLEGGADWAAELEAAMRRPGGTVVVDGIDLLPDELLDQVVDWVDRRGRPDLIFTSAPIAGLSGRAATLAGMAMYREELVALTARRAEIPELATAMLKDLAPHRPVHLAPSLIRALVAQTWPGNLRELKAVVAHLATQRSAGALTVADLPQHYRSTSPEPTLSALESAQRAVIITALREADGVKRRAAEQLGMSRTTLYTRMRTLHITTY